MSVSSLPIRLPCGEVARERRLDVAVRRQLEQRLGQRAAQHAHHARRAAVVVDRRTLAVLPAQQPGVIIGGGANQVALVAVLREVQVFGQVVEVDLEARQFFDETGQVGPGRQRVEVAEHRLKIVGHGSAHFLKLKVTLNSRGGLAIQFFSQTRANWEDDSDGVQCSLPRLFGVVQNQVTVQRGWTPSPARRFISSLLRKRFGRASPSLHGPVHARQDATLLRQPKRLSMPQARNFVEVSADPSGQPSTLQEPAAALEPAANSALRLLVKTALSGLQTTTDLYSAIAFRGQRDEGFNNCSG